MTSRSRYGAALALLLTAYVVGAFPGTLIQLFVDFVYAGLLILVVLDPRAARRIRFASLGLVIVSLTASVAYAVWQPAPTALGPVSLLLNAALIATAMVLILYRLAAHDQVTLSTVMGAVLAYALLAFLFSALYLAIALGFNEPFFEEGFVDHSEYLYFSFVTLTTLGFGDLTPALEIGQRLVVIEAFLGQVFLVVLVARMVSMWRVGGRGDETELETSLRVWQDIMPALTALDREKRSADGAAPEDLPADQLTQKPESS